ASLRIGWGECSRGSWRRQPVGHLVLSTLQRPWFGTFSKQESPPCSPAASSAKNQWPTGGSRSPTQRSCRSYEASPSWIRPPDPGPSCSVLSNCSQAPGRVRQSLQSKSEQCCNRISLAWTSTPQPYAWQSCAFG